MFENWGIATPVCALARNDMVFRQSGLSLWERCRKAAERVLFALSVSFADSSPRVGAKEERSATFH